MLLIELSSISLVLDFLFHIFDNFSTISNKIKRHSITKKGLEIIEYFNSMRMLNGVLFLHNRYIRSILETHSIFRDEKHDGEIFLRNYLWWEIRAFWSHGTSYSCEVLIPFLRGNKVKVSNKFVGTDGKFLPYFLR